MPPSRTSEHAEQCALFTRIYYERSRYPELRLLFAIPNGGKRDPRVARKMKEEGVQAGVPDCFLPVPRGTYHGFFLEMKYGHNKPTPLQRDWGNILQSQGYYYKVCYSAEEAFEELVKYLNLKG